MNSMLGLMKRTLNFYHVFHVESREVICKFWCEQNYRGCFSFIQMIL